jgi:hypothetical protein
VKAEWSKMPLSCGGGYGVPLDHEVYIDERLKDNPHRPIKNHCDIDILCIDQIDCLQQLDLLKT